MKKIKNIVRKLFRLIVGNFGRWMPAVFFYTHKGYCPCCRNKVTFMSINSCLREFDMCPICFSNQRERAVMLTIEKYYPAWKDLDILDVSPCDRGVSFALKRLCKHYCSSHYYPSKPFGDLIGANAYNEDLEKLTFPDASFDIVVTQDVLEHVYDVGKAFSEIGRVLKRGGAYIYRTCS